MTRDPRIATAVDAERRNDAVVDSARAHADGTLLAADLRVVSQKAVRDVVSLALRSRKRTERLDPETLGYLLELLIRELEGERMRMRATLKPGLNHSGTGSVSALHRSLGWQIECQVRKDASRETRGPRTRTPWSESRCPMRIARGAWNGTTH